MRTPFLTCLKTFYKTNEANTHFMFANIITFKFLLVILTTLIFNNAKGQCVFITNDITQAHRVLYLTNNISSADTIINVSKYQASRKDVWYFTDLRSQAEVTIYITKFRSQANKAAYLRRID